MAKKRKASTKKPPPPKTVRLKELTQAEFLMHYDDRHRYPERSRPFCFILGAGASVESGILAARALVDKWLEELHAVAQTAKSVKDWVNEGGLDISGLTYDRRAEFYNAIYDIRFRDREEDGARFLESVVSDKQPSYGYAVLAQLLAGRDRVVITTNFDSLASDAVFQFGGSAPFICGHESLAGFITSTRGRPIIVKLHRDILTGPINSSNGVESLATAWHQPVHDVLSQYTPVFIGYGGNDGSLMTFLEALPEGIPDRVYWCQYKHDDVNERVAAYLQHPKRWLIKIDGFDQLMQSLEKKLQLPDLVDELERINSIRVLNLRASRNKLIDSLDETIREGMQESRNEEWEFLQTRLNLADALHDQGRYAEAESELRDIIAIQERVLGPEHPDTLSSRNNLANALSSQGKYAEAEAEHRAVLAIRERVLGPEHPDTLSSRNNLANALYAQGKYAEAEEVHRAVLAIRERVLGPEHTGTLKSRNNLANALSSQGKYAEAEAEHRAVLAIRERVLGPEHTGTLNSRNNLANALDDQGKHAEAEAEHCAVLALRERVLGPEHPDVLQSCHNLSLVLENLGRKAEALDYARRALTGYTKVLGAEHRYSQLAKRRVARLDKK